MHQLTLVLTKIAPYATYLLVAAGLVATAILLSQRKYAHGIISAALGCGTAAYWAMHHVPHKFPPVGVVPMLWALVWVVVVVVLWKVGPSDEAISRFVRESYVETRFKSAWPTWTELRQFTLVVIFALLVVSVWIGGIDFVLGRFTQSLGR